MNVSAFIHIVDASRPICIKSADTICVRHLLYTNIKSKKQRIFSCHHLYSILDAKLPVGTHGSISWYTNSRTSFIIRTLAERHKTHTHSRIHAHTHNEKERDERQSDTHRPIINIDPAVLLSHSTIYDASEIWINSNNFCFVFGFLKMLLHVNYSIWMIFFSCSNIMFCLGFIWFCHLTHSIFHLNTMALLCFFVLG